MWLYINVSYIILLICVCHSQAKIVRNKALMEKMVSNFHRDNVSPEKTEIEEVQVEEQRSQPTEQAREQEEPTKIQRFYEQEQEQNQEKPKESSVLAVMQKVLCKNFPTIPCDIITKDDTLKRLIQRSIIQKRLDNQNVNNIGPTQSPVGHLTFFPVVDSEDLSNFLLVRDPSNLYTTKSTDVETSSHRHKKKLTKNENQSRKSRKKQILNSKDTGSIIEGSRKKIRKFYPHKLKALVAHAERHSLPTYSEERTSMSVEIPDTGVIRKRRLPVHDEDYPPVWRIDYLKHGDPAIATIDHENDYFQGRITKTGDNVIVDENVLEPASRRDVLHPDLYIKKNYGRKSPSTTIL